MAAENRDRRAIGAHERDFSGRGHLACLCPILDRGLDIVLQLGWNNQINQPFPDGLGGGVSIEDLASAIPVVDRSICIIALNSDRRQVVQQHTKPLFAVA